MKRIKVNLAYTGPTADSIILDFGGRKTKVRATAFCETHKGVVLVRNAELYRRVFKPNIMICHPCAIRLGLREKKRREE